jgi:triosephosphate isomerase
MLNMIKAWLSNNKIDNSINILYGGSVNKNNAKEIFSCINLGGLLIGGVSLKPEEFSEICLMAN